LNNLFSENRAFLDNVEKYGRAREAKDDNIEIRLMCFSCWITEVTGHIHNKKKLLLFYGNNGCTDATQFYVFTYIACFAITQIGCVHCTVRAKR